MSDALPYPYNLGMEFPVMPMEPVAAHCLSVPAGPVTLVVEARDLAIDRRYSEYGDDGPIEPDETFDDFGASLHVNGAADGVERLRFDCFDKEPHYHYIRPGGERQHHLPARRHRRGRLHRMDYQPLAAPPARNAGARQCPRASRRRAC